jgi:hypothetical protein
MPERWTTDAIFLLRQLWRDIAWEQKKDPHIVSIDLEKAYGKIIRMVMWWTDGETQSSNNTLV